MEHSGGAQWQGLIWRKIRENLRLGGLKGGRSNVTKGERGDFSAKGVGGWWLLTLKGRFRHGLDRLQGGKEVKKGVKGEGWQSRCWSGSPRHS